MRSNTDAFIAATRDDARACDIVAKRNSNTGLLRFIGAGSVLLGCVLACCAANPGVLTTLGTIELLGIITLALAPVLTLLAIRLERRWTVADSFVDSISEPAQIRTTTHEAHDRPARPHLRPVEAQEESRDLEHAA